jgi:hypothetical protein
MTQDIPMLTPYQLGVAAIVTNLAAGITGAPAYKMPEVYSPEGAGTEFEAGLSSTVQTPEYVIRAIQPQPRDYQSFSSGPSTTIPLFGSEELTALNLELAFRASGIVASIATSDETEAEETWAPAREFLAASGKEGLSALQFAIASEGRKDVHWGFIRQLGHPDLRPLLVEARPMLLRALNSPSGGDRSAAVAALAAIGDRPAKKAIADRARIEENRFVLAALKAYI